MLNQIRAAILLAAILTLAGCAAAIVATPVSLVSRPPVDISISRTVEITLSTHYTRMLSQGSRWRKVGALPEGEVYRPIDTVFTIEGRNVHEAYLVISPTQSLVGFYLPGESTLSVLNTPVPLTLKEEP